MEATLKNSDRHIPIPIHHQPTRGAGMRALTQRLGDQLTTAGAHLGSGARVYEHDSSASLCRFGDSHTDTLRPRHVQNAFSHPAALTHFLRGKVFKYDHLITIDQLAAFLMGEIALSVGNLLVYLGKDRLLFRVFGPVLDLLGGVLPEARTCLRPASSRR